MIKGSLRDLINSGCSSTDDKFVVRRSKSVLLEESLFVRSEEKLPKSRVKSDCRPFSERGVLAHRTNFDRKG